MLMFESTPRTCRTVPVAVLGLFSLLAPVAASAQAPGSLPADIQNVIRKEFDDKTHYLDASADLNGDGKPEIVVYVVGPMACGTGGCPTMVFTPAATGSGYRRVSTINLTRPPIRAVAATTSGWRNLIVNVSGGGAKSRDVELLFDGRGYPTNPTVASARVKAAAAQGGDLLIKEYRSFDETKPLSKPGGR
jgi:hypothetical protein